MPSPPAVSATALSRTYGYGPRAVEAVRDVDLTVGSGVLTAVAGRAGAGPRCWRAWPAPTGP